MSPDTDPVVGMGGSPRGATERLVNLSILNVTDRRCVGLTSIRQRAPSVSQESNVTIKERADSRVWHAGLHWYVLRSHYREELRAESNLLREGIETFLPRTRRGGKESSGTAVEALFPQYLFGYFDAERSLRQVGFTRGIQGVLNVGGVLATVDQDIISVMRSRVGEDGLVEIGARLQPGDRVVISAGPFASFAAVVDRNLPARERVRVLLANVNRGLRVELDTDCIQRIA